jgi:hypothetical protein
MINWNKLTKIAAVSAMVVTLSAVTGLHALAASQDEELAKVEIDGAKPFWINGGVYVVNKAKGPIKIDGRLDEPDWKNAGKVVLVRFGCTKPRETTIAKLLYDDKYLYWSAEMQDSDITCVSKGNNPKTPFTEEDVLELFVKPDSKDPKYWPYGYWELHVTPLGAYRDLFIARRDAGPTGRWLAYNSGMTAAVKVDGTVNHWQDRDKGWTVEGRVPLAAFHEIARKPVPGDRWKFMFGRYNYSVYFEDGLEFSQSATMTSDSYHHYEDWPYFEFGK